MARTAVTPVAFVANSSIADNAGTTIDSTLVTNGVKISGVLPEEMLIRVANTAGADKVVTVNAGTYPPALASGQGALTGTVPATSGVRWFGPLEGGRFLQSDGTVTVDFASGTTGSITVYKVPRNA